MVDYLIRRLLLVVPTLLVVSILAFLVMEAPPGDFVTTYIAGQATLGVQVGGIEVEEQLRELWGLDKPPHIRYLRWIGNMLKGELGYSLFWQAPVKDIIGPRLVLSMVIPAVATAFVWVVAFPIGIYSATHQYSVSDTVLSLVGFLGLSIPNFLLALVLMYLGNTYFGVSVGGLFPRNTSGRRGASERPLISSRICGFRSSSWAPPEPLA